MIEIDLLCCVSIPALTQIACVLQSDRTMLLAWRGDLQVTFYNRAELWDQISFYHSADPYRDPQLSYV